MERRQFLTSGIGLAPLLGMGRVAGAQPQQTASSEGQGLTCYQLGPQIWVRWNNELMTCYRAHPSQKYPYFYPATGPLSGRSLTSESALPWPHHRSLFFGCDKVNGANYWQEGYETGQIISAGPKIGKCTRDGVEILDQCEWKRPNQPPDMRDERRITILVPNETIGCIDMEIRWIAVQDVTIQKTNHSLFSIRAASDIVPTGGGHLINSEGQAGEKETAGKKAAWCCFYGKRSGVTGESMEGITLMDHPQNPWAPTPWFTRDYGFASPTPFYFMDNPWTLAAGASVLLRYRVVLHTGSPEKAGIAANYKSWVGKT